MLSWIAKRKFLPAWMRDWLYHRLSGFPRVNDIAGPHPRKVYDLLRELAALEPETDRDLPLQILFRSFDPPMCITHVTQVKAAPAVFLFTNLSDETLKETAKQIAAEFDRFAPLVKRRCKRLR